MLNVCEIIALSKDGERRNYEFKRSMNWQDCRIKIIKSIMAMSNIQDGGTIILGIEEDRSNNSYNPIGMTQQHLQSFSYDIVSDEVSAYADPYVTFLLETVQDERRSFLCIKVEQFDEVPTVCKKNYQEGKDYLLVDGAIYTRTKGGRPRSTRVMSSGELREITNLAIKKGVKRHVEEAINLGLFPPSLGAISVSDEQRFDDQVEELK